MKKAFSLVELIVGITISMILMVSVGIFVNSGMQSIFLQQKSINNISNLNDFAEDIYTTFESISSSGAYKITSDGIIFKRSREFDKGGFSYIGISELDNYYCDTDAEESKTKHIFIKNFIPFEEDGENINSSNGYLEILSGSTTHNGNTYISYQKEHKITDDSGNTIIGRGIFGDDFEQGDLATDIFLNSPTGLASDSEVLYFSDTLNNRVLYLSGGLVFTLVDETAGLNEPTGLFYDSNELYIANSGEGEILKISSEIIATTPDITLSFSGVTESGVSEIYLDFFKNSETYNINNVDIDASDIHSDDDDDEKKYNDNTLSYDFKTENIDNSDPMNPITTIVDTSIDFNPSTEYEIELSNLTNFSEAGVYTINLIIGSTEKTFYYFTQGDGKIYTKNDNKIEIVNSGLDYPTGFSSASSFNEFDISSSSDLDIDYNNDIILEVPVEELTISENSDLINLILKYYKNYNCYNIDSNTGKIRTFISKINVK